MKIKMLFLVLFTQFNTLVYSQSYPTFGPETSVTINGLTFDAMEPFISLDGNTLFFNSLNAGGNTNLYYASKINDSTFTYVGLVNGTYDSSTNHLDGVPSIDAQNNFFWTSLRGYPAPMENLHHGIYSMGQVTNITRVYGNFNIYTFNYPFGWLIMDAAINYQGDQLYYCNAKFDFSNTTCVGVPCESKIGVAQKINDSTFTKLTSSDAIFSYINDTTHYIVYAPQVTKDGLELYYTRLQKGSVNTEICVSVRQHLSDTFSKPVVIHSNLGYIPEAASPTTDKQKIYYHQKDGSGIFHVYLRYRTATTAVNKNTATEKLKVYPNPTNSIFHVALPDTTEDFSITVYSSLGQVFMETSNSTTVDISNFPNGIYFLIVKQNDKVWSTKIIKK